MYPRLIKILVLQLIFLPLNVLADVSADIPISHLPAVQSEDQFLLSLGRLTGTNDFISRSPSSGTRYMFDCGVSNTHNLRRGFFEIDAESYTCGGRFETSLNDDLRFSFSSFFINTGSGVFDSSIRHFHNIFGFPNGPRRSTNQNRYVATGRLNSGERFNIEREDFGLRDPMIAASYSLLEISKSETLYLEGMMSLPLGLSEYSLSKPDFKISLVITGTHLWLNYSSGVSAVFHFDRQQHGVQYEFVQFAGFFSSIVPITETFSLVLGTTLRSNMAEDVALLPNYAWYLDTGVRYVYGSQDEFVDVVLRENPAPDKGTTDVSLFIRFLF